MERELPWWAKPIKTGASSDKGENRHSVPRSHGRESCVAANSTAATVSEYHIPSWRLKEEADKRRLLQAEVKALKARIAELEMVIRAGRLREAGRLS